MDELFGQLLGLTEEAVERSAAMTNDEWRDFMSRRTALILQIRRTDAETEDAARGRYQPIVERLAQLDREIVARMADLRDEASKQLQGIQAGRRQRQVYEHEDIMEEGFFVDKRR